MNRALLILCIIFAAVIAVLLERINAGLVFGLTEMVAIQPSGLELPAKLDTGARSSSISAIDIHTEQGPHGKPWVRFRVVDKRRGIDQILKYPLVKHVRIKNRANARELDGDTTRRPVVSMPVCIRGVCHKTQVNLVDRRAFLYPMLIGRLTINHFGALIDPAKRNSVSSSVPQAHKSGGH